MRTAVVVTVAALASALGPAAVQQGPNIPACAEDDHVSIEGTCVHPDTADYDNGYWREDR